VPHAAQTCDFLLVNLSIEPAIDGYRKEALFLEFMARNRLASQRLPFRPIRALPEACQRLP